MKHKYEHELLMCWNKREMSFSFSGLLRHAPEVGILRGPNLTLEPRVVNIIVNVLDFIMEHEWNRWSYSRQFVFRYEFYDTEKKKSKHNKTNEYKTKQQQRQKHRLNNVQNDF